MTSEKAIQWIEREKFNQWRLFRGDNDKVSEYDSGDESYEDSIDRLRDVLLLLYPGKYTLKGWVGKNKQAAQSSFIFDVKTPSVSQTSPMHPQSQNFNPKEIFEQAEASALIKFQMEQWRKDVDKRLDKLESDVLEIAKSIKDLHNDDDDDDDDALDRMTGIAERIPKLASGMGALRGMLNGK
ncbi:hypothetical protein [Dyadobacter bucti]|uniref:hypothetical protein n=1 Tax=Dyadobacter bucti TaxID=2572203 RepID=UPI003F72DFCB